MIRLSLAALTLLFPIYCFSQEVWLIGFEDSSCGAWAQSAARPGEREIYLFWIRGFVSGHNANNPANQIGKGQMPNNATLALYVDRFCRENPLFPFYGAAFNLVKELAPMPAAASKDSPVKSEKSNRK